MRVSSSLFYDRAATAMGRLSSQADKLQTQIATTKRLAAPSDDSAAYARLRGLARDTANAKVDGTNLDVAAAVLAQADTTLSGITSQIQAASELVIRARNGINDPASFAALAEQIDAIRDQLVSLGNTTDARGQPLFGGADGGAAVTRNGDGTYTFASTTPSAIPTGNGQSVQPSENATRIFKQGAGDLLTTLDTLSAALRGGGAGVDAAAATAVTALQAASTQAITVQASLGARASRVELEQAALTQSGVDREAARSALEDTDVAAAITELQKTMTILSATQASFTKMQGLSLFDYLR